MGVNAAAMSFVGSLLLSVVSGAVLGKRIEQLGVRLGMTEALLGIVTALGADAPEIASAVTALHRGRHDLGLGIVFGSNLFNLATLLGLSAVVAAGLTVSRRALVAHGGVATVLTVIVAAHLRGWLSAPVEAVLIGAVFVPYVALSALTPRRLAALRLPFAVAEEAAEIDQDARADRRPRRPAGIDVLTLAPSVVAIVVASVWMIDAVRLLGARWRVSEAVLGGVIMASVTSVPNAVAAIGLARRGRGAAVVSTAFTSNSLNLIAGVVIPALMVPVIAGTFAGVASWWLIAMSIVAIGLAWSRRGLTRVDGGVLLAIYAAFLGVVMLLGASG